MEQNNVVTSNLLWRLLERFGAQGVTLVVSIVLARLLDPSVYGTIALVTVITTVLQVFVDGGLGTALIQKNEADSLDFSTVFYFNFFVCIVLYLLLFFCAPYISLFYERPELSSVIRVLGLILIISGFKNIQHAYVSRHLLFKLYFFATLGGTISAAIIGIWMAYQGFGVWALVAQNLINQGIDTMILWVLVKWRPTKEFSFDRLKTLFSYSWKLLVSSLLDTVWNQLRQLIIGKKYSTSDLAYYNKGNEYPQYVTLALNSSIDSVLLPVMSQTQDDSSAVKAVTRRAIKTGSFVLWPLMMGLAACSRPLVSLVLTDKWLPSVPYLIIFCIVYAFYPIHTVNLNAIKALGRSDLYLFLEIIKKVVGIVILLVAMRFGVMAMAYSLLLSSVFSQIINSWPNRKLLNYAYLEQLKDILPSILLSVFMGCCVYLVNLLGLPSVVTLMIQVPLGAVIYIGLSAVLHLESFEYLIDMIRSALEKFTRK